MFKWFWTIFSLGAPAFTLAALSTDGMQSPPRLKLAVIAPVDEDILVRSSYFNLLYFIFITPPNKAMLSGVFLECLTV